VTNSSGSTRSIWFEIREHVPRPALEQNVTADVCVIGAGITGLTTAYLLACTGRSVIVMESGQVGGGETGRTTAHLSNALDDRYSELESLHGAEGARLAAKSHAAAIDQIENIIAAERINCDFQRVDGFLFDPTNDGDRELHAELAAAQRAGLTDTQIVERAPLASFDTGACLRFPNQAQFHPLKYLYKLASAFEQRGGRIFGNTHAKQVEDGTPATVTTEVGHTVTADFVVVATNTPINDVVKIHTKQAPYRTYVVGLRIPRDSVPRALYWDTLDPYHYVRVQPEETHDVLIVGGEDHKTGQGDDKVNRFDRLERWTRERFSAAQEVVYSWSVR